MENLLETTTLADLAIPFLIVVAGVLVGLLLEKVILRWLDVLADYTEWKIDNIVFKSIRGVPVYWGAAAGLYLATLTLNVNQDIEVILGKALMVAVLWSFTIIAARVSAGLTSSYAGREASFLPVTSLVPGLMRLLVYIVGVLIILSTLRISIAPLLTALGVGGLAVALALQNTLANVFAGLYLIASGQIKPGHYVRLDSGEEGYTLDIDWRSTTVRTVLGNTVIIPNATMASSIVTNFTLGPGLIYMRIPVAVDYESDLRHVETVTREVARSAMRAVDKSLEDVEPQVFFHTFGEFSMNLTVVVAVREYFDRYHIKHEFMIQLTERFKEEGINIPFPIKEFEMELSTEGLDAEREGSIERPDWQDEPAREEGEE